MKHLALAFSLLAFALRAEEVAQLCLPPADAQPVADAPCLVCHGAGKTTAEDRGVQSSTTGKTPFVVTCRVCRGTGHHVRRLAPAERLERQRAQRQRFDREQLAAGHVPLAGAYAERGAADALAPEAFARLAQRCPKPCKACLGLGIEPCRKCKGLGKVTERERGDDSEAVETEANCPTCHGTATQPCRRCDGARLAPLCKKCGGTGATMGKAKKDLPARLERCRSCKGEGRK